MANYTISSITVGSDTYSFSGGGSGGASAVSLSQSEYDALTTSQKMNGTIYFVYTPDHIEVTTMPTKTEYHGNDCEFNSAGLVISFVTNDGGNTTNVTSSITMDYENGDMLTIPDGQSSQVHTVHVSYATGGNTYTTSFNVTAYET